MNLHSLARTTPRSRALILERQRSGMAEAAIAEQLGLHRKTVRKWVRRGENEGPSGLLDRSSRPHRSPTQLPQEWRDAALALRRLRFTQHRIAGVLGVTKSRIQRVCSSGGLARLSALDPVQPDNRYVRSRPGELIHLDTKKLGRFTHPGHRVTGNRSGQTASRGVGWHFLHVAIDDATRLAYAEILPDECGISCAAFLRRTAAFFSRHGIGRIERVMSDNGSGYVSRVFGTAIHQLEARHLRTRPFTPRTNGKAERLIQTMLRTWAYVRSYGSSDERSAALPHWLIWYNRQRPHGSLEARTPLQTLRMLISDNVLGHHI